MPDEYLRRTAVTRLVLTDEQQNLLEETISQWKTACNIGSRVGWKTDETRATVLQDKVYDELRERTDLGSQHAILAVRQAAAALDGVNEIEATDENYETSRPTFTSDTITYDPRTMTVFDDQTVSLATIDDRIRCDIGLPSDEEGYQFQYLRDDEWEITESTVSKRDEGYYLHIGFRKPKPTPRAEQMADDEDRTVLGVDLGIVNIATTSTAYFASGRELRHRHREFERVRSDLYETGTQSAYRTIRQMSGRGSRYVRDVLHRVANDVVEEATTYDCEYIVFENLKHIRERAPPVKQFHQWAHRQLVDMVEYKAKARGICVEFVPPENTSRRCPECGHTSRKNRRSQSDFECRQCGAIANADYVGAKNVGLRFVRRGLQSSRRTGDSQLALKSGTVTPNRGFSPYATG
ncbi:RNA-guided endonuclease InsQ/TnpB family protein [Natronobacterium gregoryi]|uniref:Transposase n=1 Tax=Natronobacterium gregoryi (strain ATCC 43098 / DSM 3393 / CCM 3738 / CIP 104747 / IAM 13177 / JCM 8860 / NBRC 102187 / NCIMB 2189 / SP2) TaxID=797304 RepID=L9Y2S2_NATGS|nr:RNA-guided endonuclease TnpB family protein [Natronobacterium gregoryi]ELY68360.1 IS1341-type transposase (TCE32) [Natronobacterium gregoryi SP2]PLK20599.1 transposase [Natronobacterium gregoryi SP2]